MKATLSMHQLPCREDRILLAHLEDFAAQTPRDLNPSAAGGAELRFESGTSLVWHDDAGHKGLERVVVVVEVEEEAADCSHPR